jgi:hypothetical protein
MVTRLMSVSYNTELTDLHDVFQQVLGWSGQLGYSFRIHRQEFNSFRRRSRSKSLREFACIARRSFFTSTTSLGCGNRNSAYWTFNKVRQKIQNRFAWADAALRPQEPGGHDHQRSGVGGGNDSATGRYSSRSTSQHVEFASGRRSGRVAERRSAPKAARTVGSRSFQSARTQSAVSKRSPGTGGFVHEVPRAGDLCGSVASLELTSFADAPGILSFRSYQVAAIRTGGHSAVSGLVFAFFTVVSRRRGTGRAWLARRSRHGLGMGAALRFRN